MDNLDTKDNAHNQAISPKTEIGVTISHAMRHTWKNFGTMFLIFLAYWILMSLASYLTNIGLGSPLGIGNNGDAKEASMFFLLAGVIIFLVVVLLIAAIFKGFITTDDEEKVSLGEFFSIDKNVVSGFFTSVVTLITCSIPTAIFSLLTMATSLGDTAMDILSIVATILTLVLSFYLFYSPLYSLEDGVGPFTAMGRSFNDVSKSPLYVLGLFASLMLIVTFGSLLIIPIIFLVPMSMVACANSYRAISRYRTEDVVKNIDRMFTPAVEPSETGAERDMNAILRENNVDTL